MCFLSPDVKFFQTKADSIILAILKRQDNLDVSEVILPMLENQNGEIFNLLGHNQTQRRKREKYF